MGERVHRCIERVGVHHLVHKTDAVRLGRAEALGRQKIAVRRPCAHGADHIGADGGGDQAQLHLAQAIGGGVHTDRHVAGRHQAHAAGKHIALHPRHRGFGAVVNGLQHGRELARVGDVLVAGVVGHAAHPVEVGTGTKGRALGGQHHRAHVVARAHRFKSGCELGNHLVVEGVAHLGSGQGDARHAVVHRHAQGWGHGRDSSCNRYTRSSSGAGRPHAVRAAVICPRWWVPWLNTWVSVAAKGKDMACPRILL